MRRVILSAAGALRGSVRSVRNNYPLLLLSLGLATVLWTFVTNQNDPPERVPFADNLQISPSDAVNVPKDMVVTGLSESSVALTLVGDKQAIDRVTRSDVILDVDLSGSANTPGLGTGIKVQAPVKATIRRAGVRYEVQPDTVDVTLEPEEHRTVPVKVVTIDSPPTGYELNTTPPVSDPDTATIAGLKQNVDAVDAVYADLKLDSFSVSSSVTLPLSPRSDDGRTVSGIAVQPASANVKVDIKQTIYNRDVFVSAQTDGKPAAGYQVQALVSDPPAVTVAASQDLLKAVTSVSTAPVEIEGATQDVRRVVDLVAQPGITVVNPHSVTVTVHIVAAHGTGSALVAPRVLGLAPGETVQLSVPSVIVEFEGPLPQVLAVRPGDIACVVDVSGLAAGTYSLDVRVNLPQGLDKDAVTPAKIDVTVSGPAAAATPTRQ